MNHATAMKSIDTAKALNFLEIEATPNGSYLKFSCTKCQKEAVIRTYGEKKNVWFCPECRGAAARLIQRDIPRIVQPAEILF